MSAVAMGLLKKGYSISGSDLVKNNEIIELEKSGAIIFDSQIKQNIELLNSKLSNKLINFVVSTAIKPENEELAYCKKNNFFLRKNTKILVWSYFNLRKR